MIVAVSDMAAMQVSWVTTGTSTSSGLSQDPPFSPSLDQTSLLSLSGGVGSLGHTIACIEVHCLGKLDDGVIVVIFNYLFKFSWLVYEVGSKVISVRLLVDGYLRRNFHPF